MVIQYLRILQVKFHKFAKYKQVWDRYQKNVTDLISVLYLIYQHQKHRLKE